LKRLLILALALVFVLGVQLMTVRSAESAIPTPTGPGAATIYQVVNLDDGPITVTHEIRSSTGTLTYYFTDTLSVGQSVQYHVYTMDQVPTPFEGNLTLTVDTYNLNPPFSADVVGYDYAPSVTPTATNTPTATPTVTKTPTPTSTPSPTPTKVPFVINLPIVKDGG
jgi:hypothetical protein